MSANRATAVVFLILTAILATVIVQRRGPTPLASHAAPNRFSAARAIAVLGSILGDGSAHPIGSPAHDVVRDRVAAQFRQLGYGVALQQTFACNAYATCAPVANVMAAIPGDPRADVLMLSAHYDSVGAGAGATVGKLLGMAMASPGGIGTASMKLANGATVGAIVVVNAFGDIIDPSNGRILAGAHSPQGGWLDTQRLIESGPPAAGAQASGDRTKRAVKNTTKNATPKAARHPFSAMQNTTLAVIATDAALTKAQARKVAAMAHDGLARAIKPIHTMFDGDTIFALSTGNVPSDVTTIGAVAAEVLMRAVVRVGRMSRTMK